MGVNADDTKRDGGVDNDEDEDKERVEFVRLAGGADNKDEVNARAAANADEGKGATYGSEEDASNTVDGVLVPLYAFVLVFTGVVATETIFVTEMSFISSVTSEDRNGDKSFIRLPLEVVGDTDRRK